MISFFSFKSFEFAYGIDGLFALAGEGLNEKHSRNLSDCILVSTSCASGYWLLGLLYIEKEGVAVR